MRKFCVKIQSVPLICVNSEIRRNYWSNCVEFLIFDELWINNCVENTKFDVICWLFLKKTAANTLHLYIHTYILIKNLYINYGFIYKQPFTNLTQAPISTKHQPNRIITKCNLNK